MGKYDPAPTVAAGLVRTARDMAGLTQAELASAAGVTQQAISAYETGRLDPTVETLLRLVRAAGYDIRWRLEERDTHDESLDAFLDTLPAEARAEIEAASATRARQARLRRTKGK